MSSTDPVENEVFKGPIVANRKKPELVAIATALGLPVRNKNRIQLVQSITTRLSGNPQLETDPKFKLLFSAVADSQLLERRKTSEMKYVEDREAAAKQAETGKMSS